MSVTVGGDLLRRGDEQRREETGTVFFCFLNLFPSSLSRVLCHRFRARRAQEKRQVDAAVNLGPSSFPLKWGKCRYIYDRKQRGGLRAPTRLKGQCNVFRVFWFCFVSSPSRKRNSGFLSTNSLSAAYTLKGRLLPEKRTTNSRTSENDRNGSLRGKSK